MYVYIYILIFRLKVKETENEKAFDRRQSYFQVTSAHREDYDD